MIRSLSAASAGLLAVLLLSPISHAAEPLPLPKAQIASDQAEIREFASAEAPRQTCAGVLKKYDNRTASDRIEAIKAYRQCRADHTLSQLAVWRWQDNRMN